MQDIYHLSQYIYHLSQYEPHPNLRIPFGFLGVSLLVLILSYYFSITSLTLVGFSSDHFTSWQQSFCFFSCHKTLPYFCSTNSPSMSLYHVSSIVSYLFYLTSLFSSYAQRHTDYGNADTMPSDYRPNSFLECGQGEQSSARYMSLFQSSGCICMCGSPHRRTRNDYLLVGVFADVSPSSSWGSEICFLA